MTQYLFLLTIYYVVLCYVEMIVISRKLNWFNFHNNIYYIDTDVQ